MADETPAERWGLVRGADIPRHLRHLLLILQHYQGDNSTCWCRRVKLADELGIGIDVVSQSLKALADSGVVSRVWTNRNGRPTREYAIQYAALATRQRPVPGSSNGADTLSESSDCTLSESSRWDADTLSESSDSPLANPQGESERILRPLPHIQEPLKNQRRIKGAALSVSSEENSGQSKVNHQNGDRTDFDSSEGNAGSDPDQQPAGTLAPVSEWKLDSKPASQQASKPGRKRKPTAKTKAVVSVIPAILDSETFRAAWGEWLEYRKQARKPLADATIGKQLAKLAAWGPVAAIQSIDNAITGGWQGLHEPKDGDSNGAGKSSEFETVRGIVKRIWSPDLKNHREVETAIGNADLFKAAKQTGLSAIADCRDGDRETQRSFDQYLESIRKAKT